MFESKESIRLEINGSSVNFFMIADQGGSPNPPFYTPITKYVSNLMAELSTSHNTHFQFALGDNFYDDGVTSVNDTRFKDTFEDIYNSSNLVNTPWFFCLGNHDYGKRKKGNPLAQIDYTYLSKRWILPSFLYDIEIFLNSELLIKAVVIDTQKICIVGTEDDKQDYLENVIKKIEESSKTSAHYFMVMGHYHVWSIGKRGPNECMFEKLRPIFHKYDVDGYFCGHEHSMEHFTDTFFNKTVEYVVSGTGAKVRDKIMNRDKVSSDKIKFFWETNEEHFDDCEKCSGALVLAQADRNKMTFKMIDTNRTEIYGFEIKSRKSRK
ncbi:tartrate-resistant acid phosphatase type 5 [Brachionus plicatilis]|uniref:Tartrate-resistant acid phosphatase type 5 n=1 Tax=Brachionus plicatilis TaxID=10195 RepID=A0A3M7T9X7_BRAPC|nr:tartrate-resistant acid phosphatase type 5 [Brachionus plicatilis]